MNHSLLTISAWGFVMVISSFIFLYIGRLIDLMLNTEPNFMLGLMVLSIFFCISRLYKEAKAKMP